MASQLGLMATISCGTPIMKVWLRVKTLLSLSSLALSFFSLFSLIVCHICIAFPRRPSSLMHCWNSVGNIQWRAHTHTHTSVFGSLSFSYTHTHSVTLSRALMLTCSSETVGFHKVSARFALPGTVDAVSHVNLELETDVELCS